MTAIDAKRRNEETIGVEEPPHGGFLHSLTEATLTVPFVTWTTTTVVPAAGGAVPAGVPVAGGAVPAGVPLPPGVPVPAGVPVPGGGDVPVPTIGTVVVPTAGLPVLFGAARNGWHSSGHCCCIPIDDMLCAKLVNMVKTVSRANR